MRKTFLLLVMMVAAVTLNAQVFTEYFETATSGSNLEEYNDWYVSFKDGENYGVSPIIEGETLFYDNYIGSDIGKVAVLDSLVGKDSDTQRISTKVVTFGVGDTLRPVIGEKMYAAFMVNFQENSKTSFRDFFTWEGSTGSSWQRGRVFAKMESNNTDLTLAVSKNSSSSGVYVESDLMIGAVGVYHLLVVAYEAIEGDANDVISLYINPDPTLPEADQTNVLVSTDTQSDYSTGTEMKINLRQRGVGAQIGGIRVGRVWEEVLLGSGDNTAVSEFDAKGFSLYPNPVTDGVLNLKLSETNNAKSIEVYNMLGVLVHSELVDNRNMLSINTDGLFSKGVYIVKVNNASGSHIEQFIVQ